MFLENQYVPAYQVVPVVQLQDLVWLQDSTGLRMDSNGLGLMNLGTHIGDYRAKTGSTTHVNGDGLDKIKLGQIVREGDSDIHFNGVGDSKKVEFLLKATKGGID
eukprot:CAMPEP_0168608060 /NCGR_PEP_ID=MMETSP0449_2-20121227/415_1 /TAXON_ID=1082188 /ORGANISM="Strombidium rassoulzadegani, Strain ras09" /LENGTH=104 /DNA_ID=CAMNT_0008647999 /DNA_START=12 /DNA_END=326 /DNA_ORIENTATION=-